MRITIAVLIDALSWETAQQSSLLADLRAVCRPLRTVLGYSSAAVPSILTGQLPQKHGRWSYLYYDPATSPFRWTRYFRLAGRLIDNRLVDNPLLKRYIAHWTARRNGFDGYFPIYDFPLRYLALVNHCSKRWDFLPGAFACPSIVDLYAQACVQASFLTYPLPEPVVFDRAEERLREGTSSLLFLYLAGIDALGHVAGPVGSSLFRRLAWYDERLRRLLGVAEEHFGDTDLFVFSDHGMVETIRTSDLKIRIEALDLRFGQDYLAIYDSTMARFWHLQEESRQPILDVLRSEGSGRILSEKEKQRYGIAFAGDKYGETIYLLPPGSVFHPSHMARRLLAAMHGYDPDDQRSDGVFLSVKPVEREPGAITDLLDILLSSAGVRGYGE